MGPKIVIVSVVLLVGVWLLLITQGRTRTLPGEGQSEAASVSDPSRHNQAVHLLETHGIKIGDASTNDIVVKHVGGKLQIDLTDQFLGKVPDTLLGTLGWTSPSNWISEEGYSNFLDSLHTFLIEEMPEEHGHSHGEGGHEHAHDDHEHGE